MVTSPIDEQGAVVLFSNDNMLCAKAKMNGMTACDRMVSYNGGSTITVTMDSMYVDISTAISSVRPRGVVPFIRIYWLS